MQLREVENIKSKGASCGLYAVAMTVQALTGQKYDEEKLGDFLIDLANARKLTHVGELFEIEKVEELLLWVSGYLLSLDYKVATFESADELEQVIEDGLKDGYYAMIPYYAKTAYPYVPSKKPDMKNVHWGIIWGLENGILQGSQSNPYKKKALRNQLVSDVYGANAVLDGKVFEWYKYLKCKCMQVTKVPKRLAEYENQVQKTCTQETCIHLEDLQPQDCLQTVDLKGKLVLIGIHKK
ncbi:hypothetical protein [Bacillus thuringiensis]|uniref:hypothetical protein n=1 Tax=Bacillus thuringiensis TaxID=1428 RepID=UPI000BFC7734|nr:hypothetical protein [Bacillus thuringiensis]PGT89912.1 hypothetical protein COD17_09180 [Bacillus thuringiensis]